MNVSHRTLCNIVLLSVVLSLSGVCIDIDHWYAIQIGWENNRWLHYYLLENKVVAFLYFIIWGLVCYALAVRWGVVK